MLQDLEVYSTRKKSIAWLTKDLVNERTLVIEGFDLLIELINRIDIAGDNHSNPDTQVYLKVCTVTLAKANRLLIGLFDLILNGLAQESGALLRPLIECQELLIYFREDPSRIEEIISGKLPSAGEIAKKISGDYKELRNYLNSNASHFRYEWDSVKHIINKKNEVSPIPIHSINVFQDNLMVFLSFQVFIIFEGAQDFCGCEDVDKNLLIEKVELWHEKIKTFAKKCEQIKS